MNTMIVYLKYNLKFRFVVMRCYFDELHHHEIFSLSDGTKCCLNIDEVFAFIWNFSNY